ncbi:MAG: HAD hydrolase-like protein [Rhodobacteraceae bacterium]|nr:HAD hydrolase-like protein [Paracoccaceae bacterium]
MRTVIFDLDGTLADTSGDLIAAANAAFRSLGHGDLLDPAADQRTAFRGGRAMLRLGFSRLGADWSEADVDRGYPVLLQAYEADIDRHTRLYPGVERAVEALRSKGFCVGVCTNKPEGLAETLLTRLGVRSMFASMVGADTYPVRKPDPLPYRKSVELAGGAVERSFLIGDTETDRETARNAGVPSVLVTFGPDGPGVSRMTPEALLDHYDDLPDLAAGLLGD